MHRVPSDEGHRNITTRKEDAEGGGEGRRRGHATDVEVREISRGS